eukprot:jgi/Tetstr1/457350/TSEL_043953.t1
MGVSLGVAARTVPAGTTSAPARTRRQTPSVKASASAHRGPCAALRLVNRVTHGRTALQRPEKRRLSMPRSTRSRVVLAAWGADVQFEEAAVVEVDKAASNIWALTLDVGAISQGYAKPGQFIQAKVGDSKPGFFAIASPPTTDNNMQGLLKLLVKGQGETAELMCKLSPGDKLSVSSVMGKGFPVENIPAAEFPKVFIFATGSGISPIKALIESGSLEATERSNVTLYYGASDTEAMACTDDFKAWEALGVTVVPVLSSVGKGYVQDVFLAEAAMADGEGTAAILCGQKEMAMAINAALTGKGVPSDKILTNF